MLHYPLEGTDNQSFVERQANLTDFCLSILGDISGMSILEIGCGNGVQAKYILKTYKPAFVTGIDLDRDNIEIYKYNYKSRNIGIYGDCRKGSCSPKHEFFIII